MKRYPYKCAGGCGDWVSEPKKLCAKCSSEQPEPIDVQFYRWGVIWMERFDRLKWLPKMAAIGFVIGFCFLIVRIAFGAVVVHQQVAEWRQIKG
jgi:hypothetical protein